VQLAAVLRDRLLHLVPAPTSTTGLPFDEYFAGAVIHRPRRRRRRVPGRTGGPCDRSSPAAARCAASRGAAAADACASRTARSGSARSSSASTSNYRRRAMPRRRRSGGTAATITSRCAKVGDHVLPAQDRVRTRVRPRLGAGDDHVPRPPGPGIGRHRERERRVRGHIDASAPPGRVHVVRPGKGARPDPHPSLERPPCQTP
jgi:hypothetical protein